MINKEVENSETNNSESSWDVSLMIKTFIITFAIGLVIAMAVFIFPMMNSLID